MTPHIAQLSLSSGGVPNLPVAEAEVTELGLAGDGHDSDRHGGPERALCLYAVECIAGIAAEGHPIAAGSTGENITTRGLDWQRVVPGAVLRLGDDVVVEVTRYTTPCATNERWFIDGDFNRMNQNTYPGWSRVYAKVLRTGHIRPGDPIAFVEE